MKQITVKGIGKVVIPPDMVEIRMTLSALNKDYLRAMELGATQIDELRDSLMSVGIECEDIKTTQFNVRQERENERDAYGNYKLIFKGYKVTHNLQIKFDFSMAMLNKVLPAIAACHANPQIEIAFTIKNKSEVRDWLLRDAVKNATQKAQVLAEAAGVRLGSIADIIYAWDEIRLYSGTKYDRCMDGVIHCPTGSLPDFDIVPDDIDIEDTATIIWEIE